MEPGREGGRRQRSSAAGQEEWEGVTRKVAGGCWEWKG